MTCLQRRVYTTFSRKTMHSFLEDISSMLVRTGLVQTIQARKLCTKLTLQRKWNRDCKINT